MKRIISWVQFRRKHRLPPGSKDLVFPKAPQRKSRKEPKYVWRMDEYIREFERLNNLVRTL